MRVAVCYNKVPLQQSKGEELDRVSEAGAEAEAKAVITALAKFGHSTTEVPLTHDIGAFMHQLQSLKPDLVFNLCEGFWGDSAKEMNIAALLELLGLPYTGAAPITLGLALDKPRTKDILLQHGLATPPFTVVYPGDKLITTAGLSWPLIVKPAREDASLGVTQASIVGNLWQLKERVGYIHDTYRQAALVEEYIDGREINVAVIGNTGESLPLSEISFTQGKAYSIVSYEGKWLVDSPEYVGTVPVCPAPLRVSEKKVLKESALAAYNLLECRDYARVDIRLRNGIPYILEVNANPDISPDAGLARSAAAAGIRYPELVEKIAAMAIWRAEKENA